MGGGLVGPEHGAVVQIDNGVPPALARVQGRGMGAARGLLAQTRGRDPEDARLAHGLGGDVLLGQLEIGRRGLAVEVEGEVVGREDLAEGDRCVEGRLGDDVIVVDAEAAHLGPHKAAEGIVAHPGDDGGAVAIPGRRDGHVRRAAAEELAEGLHVLQPHPRLERVDVDAAAPDGQDVERWSQEG